MCFEVRIPRFSSWLCDSLDVSLVNVNIRVPVFPVVKIGIIYHCFRHKRYFMPPGVVSTQADMGAGWSFCKTLRCVWMSGQNTVEYFNVFLKLLFIHLRTVAGLSCSGVGASGVFVAGVCDLVPWPGSNPAPCIGSTESLPLDHQGKTLLGTLDENDWTFYWTPSLHSFLVRILPVPATVMPPLCQQSSSFFFILQYSCSLSYPVLG